MTFRDDLRVSKALQGLEFPMNKQGVLEYARAQSADAKTMQALETLPEDTFTSQDELVDAVPQEPEGEHQPGGTQR